MSARQLFDQILAHEGCPDVPAYLRAMIGKQHETEHLDFKSASRDGKPLPQSKINELWGEAISGFATSGGGVIVWGIDARKLPAETVDQACGVNPVFDPPGFASHLRSVVVHATDPPVQGILSEPFVDSTIGPDQGFVVSYVPDSEHKPHRCNFGPKRWIMRTSDSFTDIPAAMLRALFYPRVRSRLAIRADISSGRWPIGSELSANCTISLLNGGPATAREVVIHHQYPFQTKIAVQCQEIPGTGRPLLYCPIIHPGETKVLYLLSSKLVGPAPEDDRLALAGWNPFAEQTFTIYAADREVERLILRVDPFKFSRKSSIEMLAIPDTTEWRSDVDPIAILMEGDK